MNRKADSSDEMVEASASMRRLTVAAVTLLAAAAALAIVLSTHSTAPRTAQNAGSAAGVATVQRRNLVATDTESGVLSYAGPQTVYDRLTGTITWLPRIGQVIERGEPLFEVDDEPVILLYGSKPAYRELDSSDASGPDVGQLNANLIALGYYADGIVLDDSWQTATTEAVKALQKALGERQTGRIALGRFVFLPGRQLVDTIEASAGSPASFDRASAPRAQFVDLTSTASTSTTSTTPSTTRTTTAAPTITQTVTVTRSTASAHPGGKSSGSSGSSGGSARGGKGSGSSASGSGGNAGAAAGGAAILQTSSTRLVATVNLAASSQSEAVPGSPVTVEMPDGSIVDGTITAVSPVASSSGSGGGGAAGGSSGDAGGGAGTSNGSSSPATVPVTISLQGHIKGAGLDQAAVSVNFAQARARHVLSVPVTALVATAGDAYALQEVAAPHALLPVSTGLFAGGYVQVSGPGVHPGLEVTDSQG